MAFLWFENVVMRLMLKLCRLEKRTQLCAQKFYAVTLIGIAA